MAKQLKNLTILLLALCLSAGYVRGQTCFSTTWYFRGEAVQNNSVLMFNMYDTLNLMCKAHFDYVYETAPSLVLFRPLFAITKGQGPPTMSYDYSGNGEYALTVTNPSTLIYSDWEGLQPGFENFVILFGYETFYTTDYFRYMNVGVLRPSDSGTYHCSAYPGLDFNVDSLTPGPTTAPTPTTAPYTGPTSAPSPYVPPPTPTSGGVTIMVNTKQGQARSTRATSASNILTYSAVILGASKLFL